MRIKQFNRLIAIASLTGICSAIVPVFFTQQASAGNDKVDICHFPPGNPNNVQMLNISVNALNTHLTNHTTTGKYAGLAYRDYQPQNGTCTFSGSRTLLDGTTFTPPAPPPTSISLTGTIRDFKGKNETGGHADFERNPGEDGFGFGSDNAIVEDNLGSDKKPVYKGKTYSTTGKTQFDQWYRDTAGVNQSMLYGITLTDPDQDGVYTYDSNVANPNQNGGFFPADGKLYGNTPGTPNHNYHFTYEAHTEFTYRPGQTFRFRGDDDVWVYINGKKVIDIGGVHGAQEQTVNLDSITPMLVEGQGYSLDFFFAERHKTDSNFKIETSIVLPQVKTNAPTSPSTPTSVISGNGTPGGVIEVKVHYEQGNTPDLIYKPVLTPTGEFAVNLKNDIPVGKTTPPVFDNATVTVTTAEDFPGTSNPRQTAIPKTIVLDNIVPTVNFDPVKPVKEAINNETNDPTPTFTGKANPTSTTTPPGTITVTVKDGTNVLCTATVSSNGTWSCSPTTSMTPGTHDNITAQITTSGRETPPVKLAPLKIILD
jgi:fibro-slime domain-containing protein